MICLIFLRKNKSIFNYRRKRFASPFIQLGLDSAAALQVMTTLKTLANLGFTVTLLITV